MWYVVWWEHKTHHGVWLSCSPSIRSNWKYQIINMILHGWLIREMVGVIPRYCPAATAHRLTWRVRTWGRGCRGWVEDGGADVRRVMTVWCGSCDHIPEVRPETSPAWLCAWLNTDNAHQISSQQAGWRPELNYIYTTILITIIPGCWSSIFTGLSPRG